MTADSDYFWLRLKEARGVTVARVTQAELWKDETIEALAAELMNLVEDLDLEPKLVLDLSDVTGMGSRMIGQLAALSKQVKTTGGRLALCHVRPEVAEVIETCKLTALFGVYPDEAAAVASLAA